MTHTHYDISVARQIGSYSDAVEVTTPVRWLVTAGTPGLGLDGKLPGDINGQAEIAWKHIFTMLERAGMTANDLVKVTQYLVRRSDIPAYVEVRSRMLGDTRPASTLLVLPDGHVRSDFLLEIEVLAAKAVP